MRIASPFAPDPDETGAQAPASFGRPERRPGERDRARARTHARKETAEPACAAPTAPQGAEQRPAPDRAPGAGRGAAEEVSAARPEGGESEGGQVVPFPGTPAEAVDAEAVDAAPVPADASAEPAPAQTAEVAAVDAPGGALVPAALTDVARVWWAEAVATAGRAVDGSVWRARPPALRDSHVRLQRAEWSGGLPVLRWAGWIYGYPALAVRAVLMGVIWLLDHPTRLIVLAVVIAAALYL